MELQNVDDYIKAFDGVTKERLLRMRAIIKETSPEAKESMSYGMPAYKLNNKPLVYFAGYKNHIGFYATPNGHAAFEKEFAQYKQGKGSVQFPHDKPLPETLIKRVTEFRVHNQ